MMSATPYPADDPYGMAARFGVTWRDANAWHEAGHAVVALGLGFRVVRVHVARARGESGGCHWEDHDIANLHNRTGAERRLRATCAAITDPGRVDPRLLEACRHLPHPDAALMAACRRGGAVALAGAVATAMRRQGLTLPMRSASERPSPRDLEHYSSYQWQSPERADIVWHACLMLAADTLQKHRPVFHAFVDALLERGTMDEGEVRELWRQHAREAA